MSIIQLIESKVLDLSFDETPIIVISGPTGIGKSNLAISLAKKINGVIINADSMQIYKELKIISSQPSERDKKIISHELYGIKSIYQKFSVMDWLELVEEKLDVIFNKNKIPIIVGGTGLYFKALIDGLVKIPNISSKFRNQIRNLQKKIGQKKFYEKLLKLDPSSIGKIKPTDTQRTIRAYEVKKFTKKSLTEWFKNTKSNFVEDDFFKVYIDFPRQELIERINIRTRDMIENGALKEVKDFIKLRVRKDKSANKAIGVNEIREYLKKQKDLKDTKEKIAIKTRQYAKRQSTWARGNMMSWMKLKPKDINNFLKKI